MIVSPNKVNEHVSRLLKLINSEFAPQQVPIIVAPFAKLHNCFFNVTEKVKRDGGEVLYGWAIFQSDILCEAERHAIWSTPQKRWIDITPQDIDSDKIMFVLDNKVFKYNGQLVGIIRINTTSNSIVDDFILICNFIDSLYLNYAKRLNQDQITVPSPILELIRYYSAFKPVYLDFIRQNNTEDCACFCGASKVYKSCHKILIFQQLDEIKDRLKDHPTIQPESFA